MAGTWALARAAFAAALNGQTATPTDHKQSTLVCSEYPIGSNQTVAPYAYVIPPELETIRFPGGWRALTGEVKIRVILGGTTDIVSLTKQRDAWALVVTDAFDEKITLDGACDYIGEQSVTMLAKYDEDQAWGFETVFENFRVSNAETFAS